MLFQTIISSTTAQELLIVDIVVLALAVLSYFARLILKYRRSDGFGHDDTLVTLSLIFFIALEVLLWHAKYMQPQPINPSTGGPDDSSEILSRTGPYSVLVWSVTASAQLSVLCFYKYVCSGFSWAKLLLTILTGFVISGWMAFTVCDSLYLYYSQRAAPASVEPLLYGYSGFEISSLFLEPGCTIFILIIQVARLIHIREKLASKPWLMVVPLITALAIASGFLRLYYFVINGTAFLDVYIRFLPLTDIVSEMIWIQVHLGLLILFASVPVYTGLERMCCGDIEDQEEIETWIRRIEEEIPENLRPPTTNNGDGYDKEIELESVAGTSMRTTRRHSILSEAVPSVPERAIIEHAGENFPASPPSTSRRQSFTATWPPTMPGSTPVSPIASPPSTSRRQSQVLNWPLPGPDETWPESPATSRRPSTTHTTHTTIQTPPASKPSSRRPSVAAIWIPAAKKLSDATNWSPISRGNSVRSEWHGVTRQIIIDEEESPINRSADLFTARDGSYGQRGTKRLIMEG